MNIYAKIMVCLCLLAFALPIVIGRKCLTNLVVVEDNALGGKSYTFENSKPPRKEDCPSGYDTCISGKCKGIDFYSCASGGDICNGLDCRDNDNNNKCSTNACTGNDYCNDPNFKPPSLESDSNGANTTPLHAMMLAIGGLGTLMVAGGMLI